MRFEKTLQRLVKPYFYCMMRALLFSLLCFVLFSCSKEKFIDSKAAFIITSDTALHFNTVFTSVGSITKQLKIFNINNQKLRISNMQLMGGDASFFKMNVSGTPGTQFSDVDIEKGDSLYIFVSVNINPDSQLLPFLIKDSIRIDFNGNTQFVKLDAYGQNAHFLRSAIIQQNTIWTANLPYVLLDTFAVSAGATLTIEKGTQIYCNANTPFIVAGSLQVNGAADSTGRVTFRSNRLDLPYSAQPGSWRGIYFNENSVNNTLRNVTIENALQGIGLKGSTVVLDGCIINNCAEAGITAFNSKVLATNCLVSNCSNNVVLDVANDYTFINCTIAAYSNQYLYHQNAAVTIQDAGAVFQNCIIYGEMETVTDEVDYQNSNGTTFNVHFENTLYKSATQNPLVLYSNCLQNVDPQFMTTDSENGIFNFHITASSPCIDAGKKNNLLLDLDGKPRNEVPDIGCFEFH